MKFNNRNVSIGINCQFGQNVRIGDNSVIYDNTVIGDNTIVCNDCVIGEPSTEYYKNPDYVNNPTLIGNNCLIRSHSIIYSGNKLGNEVVTGHKVMLRVQNEIGNNCSIGNSTELHGFVKMGNYVRIHSDVCLCEYAEIGDFVWIFPGCVISNSSTPPSNHLEGPIIGDYSVIAVNSVVLPGLRVGKHCLVGASSVVTRNIQNYSLVFGNPARYVMDVRELRTLDGSNLYPWPQRFSKGMPWEEMGYETWLSTLDKNKL